MGTYLTRWRLRASASIRFGFRLGLIIVALMGWLRLRGWLLWVRLIDRVSGRLVI